MSFLCSLSNNNFPSHIILESLPAFMCGQGFFIEVTNPVPLIAHATPRNYHPRRFFLLAQQRVIAAWPVFEPNFLKQLIISCLLKKLYLRCSRRVSSWSFFLRSCTFGVLLLCFYVHLCTFDVLSWWPLLLLLSPIASCLYNQAAQLYFRATPVQPRPLLLMPNRTVAKAGPPSTDGLCEPDAGGSGWHLSG